MFLIYVYMFKFRDENTGKKIKAFLLFSNKTQNIVMTFLLTVVKRALNNQNKNREKKKNISIK